MANAEVFDSYFRRADLDKDGRISGQEAVGFFQGAGLPQMTLAKVRPLLSVALLLIDRSVVRDSVAYDRHFGRCGCPVSDPRTMSAAVVEMSEAVACLVLPRGGSVERNYGLVLGLRGCLGSDEVGIAWRLPRTLAGLGALKFSRICRWLKRPAWTVTNAGNAKV
jgi:hypothetical protein